jgi:type IV pilus assembly protein PilA
MKTIQRGFTLIELMIVVAIIGILAAVAIPAYQDYIARAQVSEAVSLLGSGKTPMAEYFASQGAWPDAASDVMGNTTGKYTSAITIGDSSAVAPGSITLIGTMKAVGQGVNINITQGTVGLNSTDGGKVWTCFTSGTASPLSSKYVPSNCRA